jgi:pimeloyl-ACP methyl ester carboxylesterase
MPKQPLIVDMKKASILSLLFISTFNLLAQDNPAYLFQTLDVAAYQNTSFRIEGQVFIEEKAKDAGAIAFAFTSSGNKFLKSFFNRHSTDAFKPNVWNLVSISGKIQKADKIAIGAMFSGKGKYYFDDFKLFITKSGGEVEVPLTNNDFESASLSPWFVSNFNNQSKITLTGSKFNSGRQSLLIDNSMIESESYGNNTKVGKYADINGIRLYYEVYGSGEPLLLMHGNNESIAAFDKQIPEFSKSYMVIALDTRGQGNSTSDSTKLTYELFAEDANKLLDYLNIKQANVLGWSDGGNIALILALKHPDKVKQIAVMAAVLYNNSTSVSNKINAIVRKQLAEMEQQNVSKNDINYRLKKLLLTEPNINPDSLAKIDVPALIMAGKNDIVKEQHTRLIAEKIPKATLRIFKNTGHDAPRDIPDEFNKTVLAFFNERR